MIASITGDNLIRLKLVDRIIPEPIGGAHAAHALAVSRVGDAVEVELEALMKRTHDALRDQRADRFYAIGRG